MFYPGKGAKRALASQVSQKSFSGGLFGHQGQFRSLKHSGYQDD